MSLRTAALWGVTLFLAAGCARVEAGEARTGSLAPKVGLTAPSKQTLSRQITVAGSLHAWQRAGVRSRISGYVADVKVDIGTRVKKGDVLAFVAVPELDAELAAAKARAAVERARATGAGDIGRVSRKRYARLSKLFKGDPDAVAADRVDAAQTHAVRFRSEQMTAEAMQLARMAELRRAEALRDYQSIRAPFDGMITARNAEVGDLVGTRDAKPLFTVASTGKGRLRFALPEGAALQATPGETTVMVSIPAAAALGTREVKVSRSTGEVDISTRTVTFEADVKLDGTRWIPGLYTRVVVDLFRKEGALAIPAKALVASKSGSFVWLCTAGKASRVKIDVGLDDGAVVEVLGGVDEGAPVVLTGKEALVEGGGCRLDPKQAGGKKGGKAK